MNNALTTHKSREELGDWIIVDLKGGSRDKIDDRLIGHTVSVEIADRHNLAHKVISHFELAVGNAIRRTGLSFDDLPREGLDDDVAEPKHQYERRQSIHSNIITRSTVE